MLGRAAPGAASPWAVPPHARERYAAVFGQAALNGCVSGQRAKTLLGQSGLPTKSLRAIWDLADLDKDGALNQAEFVVRLLPCAGPRGGQARVRACRARCGSGGRSLLILAPLPARRQVAMHLIETVRCGLPLPDSVPPELRASAGGASSAPEHAGWPDDDDGFADFTGASDNTGGGLADDDFGDFGGAFQDPGAAASPRPPVLSMDLIGVPAAAPPSLAQAASTTAMDDLFGAAPASAGGTGGVAGDANFNHLPAGSASDAAAVKQSPVASKAAQFVDLFAESFKPQPKMRDMKSPSSSSAPRAPLAANPAANSMPAFAAGLGGETDLLASGTMQPAPRSTTNQSALVFELFTDLLQKDGIIEAAPAVAVEEDFGDFVSDAAAFGPAGDGGGGLQGAAPATALSEAFSQFGVADDDFGADFGAFEGGAAVPAEGGGIADRQGGGGGKAGGIAGVLDPNDIKKGDIYWYRDGRDGVEKQVEVVSIDRTLQPPSFGIRVDGRERETEAHRLLLHPSSLPSLSVGQESSQGAVPAVPAAGDGDWGAFEGDFQGADDFGADFGDDGGGYRKFCCGG